MRTKYFSILNFLLGWAFKKKNLDEVADSIFDSIINDGFTPRTVEDKIKIFTDLQSKLYNNILSDKTRALEVYNLSDAFLKNEIKPEKIEVYKPKMYDTVKKSFIEIDLKNPTS